VKNTFYSARDNGEIIIPYQKSASSYEAVVVHRGLSSLECIGIEAERYRLECSYAASRESMILNQKGKILVMPRLYLNECLSTFQIVDSAKAEITITEFGNVSSTIKIDSLPLSRFRELELEFNVPLKIVQAKVRVEVAVKALDSEKVTLTNEHTVAFNLHQGEAVLASQYLRRNAEGYSIYVLGKNGEPKKGLIANLKFMLKGYHREVEKTLMTDAEGRVALGHLQGVRYLVSDIVPQGDIQVKGLRQELSYLPKVTFPHFFQLL
jgi:hypothetical protein